MIIAESSKDVNREALLGSLFLIFRIFEQFLMFLNVKSFISERILKTFMSFMSMRGNIYKAVIW